MRTSFILVTVLALISITACAGFTPDTVTSKVVTVLVTTTPPPTQTAKIETVVVEVTSEPASSSENKNALEPTATPAPTDTVVPSPDSDEADAEFKYPPVKLLVPVNTESFTKDREPLLRWESVGELAPDEYYEVTISRTWQDEPYYAGSDWVKEPQYLVPAELVYGTSDLDEYTWWVTVKRQTDTNESGGKVGEPLSPPSAKRTFIWK